MGAGPAENPQGKIMRASCVEIAANEPTVSATLTLADPGVVTDLERTGVADDAGAPGRAQYEHRGQGDVLRMDAPPRRRSRDPGANPHRDRAGADGRVSIAISTTPWAPNTSGGCACHARR